MVALYDPDVEQRREVSAKVDRLIEETRIMHERIKRLECRLNNVEDRKADHEHCEILVVDDDDQVTEILINVLHKYGYRVDSANTAADAIKMIRHHNYHVIMIDIMMPGVSGFDLVDMVPLEKAKPAMVAVTGLDMTTEVALLKGFDAIIHKPFEISTVLKTVEAFC